MTFLPQSEAELVDAIRAADGPLVIQGGGTRTGRAVDGADVIRTSGFSGIHLYEPGALTLVAGAGTPMADVEAALTAEGQQLAFEPMDHRGLLGTSGSPTLGGAFALNASGPRRIQGGALRDYALGVRFVDGAGRVVKSGGRVMKNVTGYDLVRLMAGSGGRLGVVTEVSLKVLPAPEARAVLLIEGLDDARAVEAMSMALTSPFDVTGAAHTPMGVDGAPVTMIRLEGFADSVAYRAASLRDRLSGFGDIVIEDDLQKTVAGWAWVRDVEAFHGRDGDVWRVSVKPGDAPGFADRLRSHMDVSVLYDWGGGLVWLLAPTGQDIRPHLQVDGHARLVRGQAAVALATDGGDNTVSAIEAGLRAKFDPRGIFQAAQYS